MIHYTQLGGTLFIPASHKHLEAVVNQNKYPLLRSLVIDFEDGFDQAELKIGTQNVANVLSQKNENSPYLFLRPKDPAHLNELLKIKNIAHADGFILPKFSLQNAQEYLEILKDLAFAIMPSIEGDELFSHEKLVKLKDLLLTNKQKIVLVRFGLEDMLRQLSMRRGCEESVFDLSVGNVVLGNFIAVFKSAGFAISGGVYPCYEDREGFIKDVKRDLKEGLFGKTLIHPKQIEILEQLYKVDQKSYDEALEIVTSTKVVFAQNQKMAEKKTMLNYSQMILKRAEIYGII